MMFVRSILASLLLPLCCLLMPQAHADIGVLDQPLPSSGGRSNKVSTPPANPILEPGSAQQVQAALRRRVKAEREALKRLPPQQLERRARQGERAAQLVLADAFVKESEMLSFAPEAANAALSDAAYWYNMAAMRGFPGAPSLDQAGVRFLPIRAQRKR